MKTKGLWSELRRLDHLLVAAVTAAEEAYGAATADDRFRGLHIGPEDVARLLARPAGVPVLHADEPTREVPSSRMSWLANRFGLEEFEHDVVLLALAPEVDLRYERLYAYLQDDVTRRRPSVDLALNLLCSSKEEKLARRARFAAGAPLLRNGVLRLIVDPSQAEPPLLAHALKLDDQVVRLLLEDQSLDDRLAALARVLEPDGAPEALLDADTLAAVTALGRRHSDRKEPVRLHLHGPDAGRRRQAAMALAAAARMRLLVVDLFLLPAADDAAWLMPVALREAAFRGAALYVDGWERLGDRESSASAMSALARHRGVAILSSRGPTKQHAPAGDDPVGLLSLALAGPSEEERRTCWHGRLRLEGVELAADEVTALADRFRLTSDQIAEAASVAAAAAATRGPAAAPTAADAFSAARDRSAWDVQGVARRITPRRSWDDLVVPEDTLAQLRELCQRALHSRRVLREWGFEGRFTLGRGATALFTGPSGTGKTMAAEVIAGALGLDLYKVDLSGVVSKWIGETEKNLDRVFRAAEGGSGVLFFDEADALFGKRSEVRDSHDRYANVEISYLLQRMEEHEGLAILATNLRANLDDAFIRRLSFVVHFPFPGEAGRHRIWQRIWPLELPTEGLDLARLARELPLTGGNIRNVALAAAYLAAADGGAVRMDHVRQAVRREFQKMGKGLTASPTDAAPTASTH